MSAKYFILIFFFLQVSLASNGHAKEYRQCMNDKMKETIKAKPCKFDEFYAGVVKGQNTCAPLLLDELMANETLKMGSPEFNSALDNKKRAAFGDAEEMVAKEGTRCGVTATMKGNKVTVNSGVAK